MIGFKMAVDGVLRGAGDMKMFTIANLVNLSIRVSMAMMLAPRFGIECIWYAVPLLDCQLCDFLSGVSHWQMEND